MVKDKKLRHNTLKTNHLPPPIGEGEENDFAYSVHLSKLLKRFVRLAMAENDQFERLDIELLNDVLRMGSIQAVVRLRGYKQPYVSQHLSKALDLLEQRVSRWEAAQTQAFAQKTTEELEQQLQAALQRNTELELQLNDLREASTETSRRLAVTAARRKSMAVEAYLREHGKT